MKKTFAVLAVIALASSALTAEVTIHARGGGLFVPCANTGASGADCYSASMAPWGDAPRVGFTVTGNSDNVGFQVDINADGSVMNLGDNRKIWVKPIDMITVTIGSFHDNTLRGDAAFGSYNWIREYGAEIGEDAIFTRVSTTESEDDGSIVTGAGGQGFAVAVRPIDAVYVVAALTGIKGERLIDLGRNMQIAAGYTLDGIGQIRAQYKSNSAYVFGTETAGMVEVALKLTMVENLMVDFGFRTWTNHDVQDETKTVSLYGNYKLEALTLHAIAIYDLNEDDDGYNLGIGADYAFDGGFGISGDVRYTNAIKANAADEVITFLASVTKGFSNGSIGFGVQVKLADDTGYAIPVALEYWF